jgi:hypothetical protein
MSDNPDDYLYSDPDYYHHGEPPPRRPAAKLPWHYILILITVAAIPLAAGDMASGNARQTATSAGPASAAPAACPVLAPSPTPTTSAARP